MAADEAPSPFASGLMAGGVAFQEQVESAQSLRVPPRGLGELLLREGFTVCGGRRFKNHQLQTLDVPDVIETAQGP